jgi:hypothetical protein
MCDQDKDCYHGKCDDLGQCVCDDLWTGDFCERFIAHPLHIKAGTLLYDLPNPFLEDDANTKAQKLTDFETFDIKGRCGKYGGQRCAQEIYRRIHPRRPDTLVPMGIRHTPHRATANATHAANGTFWGDIWGNATEMWKEIHEQEEEEKARAEELKQKQIEQQQAEAEQAEQDPQNSNNTTTTTTTTTTAPPGHYRAVSHVQLAHRNAKLARKHYNNARRFHQEAARSRN